MDNDSAHHASIALHMHLTGDYVSLIDNGKDYLDKPHFHFWLTAFSYKLFGVSAFAYKFPSLLFTAGGVYSTCRLGKLLYNEETGKLAALITASAFAFILANNDVRMDAILTSCIVFSIWQLVALVQQKKITSAVLAALGLAMGFSTKGHIGIVIPAVAVLFYIVQQKEWKIFRNWNWWLMMIVFLVFIAPELYCYYLQFNRHPEKVVRGKDHIDGIRFIVYGQSLERFDGDNFGAVNKRDYFFFLHTFLWAFAPWSILAYWAVSKRVNKWRNSDKEWLTAGCFISMLIIISFSGFKLPHYLNIIFPTTAILTASFILEKKEDKGRTKIIFSIQIAVLVLLLLLTALLTGWVFPVKSPGFIVCIILLLSLVFYFIKTPMLGFLQKAVAVPVAAIVLLFFCLNMSFYPRLLQYQGGNELARITKGKVDPAAVYNWKEEYSSSYNFYTHHLTERFHDSLFQKGEPVWLLYDEKMRNQIDSAGYKLHPQYSVPAYRITQLGFAFLNPQTRDSACSRLVLAIITR
jgi:4-amino-4-deoxy-L-arabinose transferase-like glycosyltransferase